MAARNNGGRPIGTTTAAMAIVAIAAAMAAPTARAQQLLTNGDFEQGNFGEFGAPSWTAYNFAETSGEYARTEGGKSFKSYGPWFTAEQAPGSVGIQSAAATPGTSYRLDGFMFSPTTDHITGLNVGVLELHFLDSGGGVIAGSGTQRLLTANASTDVWLPYSIDAVAPAGAARAEVVIGHIQINNPVTGGAAFWDDLSLRAGPVTSSGSILAAGGSWTSGSTWQGGTVPNAVDAEANLNSGANLTIPAAGVTSGTVRFHSTSAITVAGPGSLALDSTGPSATLAVTAGSHTISAPLVVNKATVAGIAPGQTLNLQGNVTLANGASLTTSGLGTLRIASPTAVTGSAGATIRNNGGILQADADLGTGVDVVAEAGDIRSSVSQHVRSLVVVSGAKTTLSDVAAPRVLRTGSLTIKSGGTLDLGDNGLVLDYDGAASPAAAIRAAISTGKATAYAGPGGIVSSKAAGNPRYGIGYAEASAVNASSFLGEAGIDSTTLLVRVTLNGDTNLSGNVGFDDLLSLAKNYNGTGKVWSQGDFDYDGSVLFGDLLALAKNYNASVSGASLATAGASDAFIADFALAQSLVPEPGTAFGLVGLATIIRRRRIG